MTMRLLAGAAALAISAAGAQAATISSVEFTKSNYESQLALLGSTVIVQNFESYDEDNVPVAFATNVGTFYTSGGKGSGGTVTDPSPDLDGTRLAIRDENVYGRSSTTSILTGNAGDDMFLDSNDTYGIKWLVNIGSAFNRLIFTLTDVSDQGALLRITSTLGGQIEFQSQRNANRKIIVVDFGGFVDSAEIHMTNFFADGETKRINDGFSIDDIAVSAVPLPAPAFMLIAGLAGLAALRRKRSAA
jgi:hypothetical protein